VRYTLECYGDVLGYSELEARGCPRGVLRGAFEPGPAFDRYRALFRAAAVLADAHAAGLGGSPDARRLEAQVAAAQATFGVALALELVAPGGLRLPVAHAAVRPAAAAAAAASLDLLVFLAVPGRQARTRTSHGHD
jgi:hypothetical protein